ncbi:hypothetical protein FZEAL_760, partial [Fusarium zealandicum]
MPLPLAPVGRSITHPRYPRQLPQAVDPTISIETSWAAPNSPVMMDDSRSYASSGNFALHSDEPAHDQPRRPSLSTLKAGHTGTIEKSGLRYMIDKHSGDVRKGIAKTFGFRKKDKDEGAGKRDIIDAPPSITQPRAVEEQHERHSYGRYTPAPMSKAQTPSPYVPSQYPLPSPPSPHTLWNMSPVGPPPTSKLPPTPRVPPVAAPQIKRWLGGGRPVVKWNKLRKDPELWDPNGDVLVFLGRKDKARQLPSLRLSSNMIEATGSRRLITLLLEGSTAEEIYLPPSPSSGSQRSDLDQGFGDVPLTPPVSETASIRDFAGQISYEMRLSPPRNLSTIDQLRHRITTRNVFALLHNASIIGLALHQALSDLHVRLDSYMPPQNDNVGQIVQYIYSKGLDDVRSDPETAVSLLAWAEDPDVRWEDGWRECFTHCVGMYPQVEKCKHFTDISLITKAMLETASLDMQLRVRRVEERLAGFEYDDMWALQSEESPARKAAQRLRDMLKGHYERAYGTWPPVPPGQSSKQYARPNNSTGGETWLTRTLVMALQQDFGALYDYIVDRDIIWDVSEARSGRKWIMASERGDGFEADTVEVPMTDMLIEFDNSQQCPHIPHPYPLLPESRSRSTTPVIKVSHGLTSSKGSIGDGPTSVLERQAQVAQTESTNIYALDKDLAANELVDAFERFEKSDEFGEINAATGRRGRWVLIYGILQALASVSVDDRWVRHRDQVEYHLCPSLEGTKIPPWRRGRSNGVGAGAHERSFCWAAAEKWGKERRSEEAEREKSEEEDEIK